MVAARRREPPMQTPIEGICGASVDRAAHRVGQLREQLLERQRFRADLLHLVEDAEEPVDPSDDGLQGSQPRPTPIGTSSATER